MTSNNNIPHVVSPTYSRQSITLPEMEELERKHHSCSEYNLSTIPTTIMDDALTSRSFRHLRRSLGTEMTVNALMLKELKCKDKELNGLYNELDALKEKAIDDIDYEKTRYSGTLMKNIKIALSAPLAVMHTITVDSESTMDIDEIWVINRLIELRHKLHKSLVETQHVKQGESSSATQIDDSKGLGSSHLKDESNDIIGQEDNEATSPAPMEMKNLEVKVVERGYKGNIKEKYDILLSENLQQREEVLKTINKNTELKADLQTSRKDVTYLRGKHESVAKQNGMLKQELKIIKSRLLKVQDEIIELQNESDKEMSDSDMDNNGLQSETDNDNNIQSQDDQEHDLEQDLIIAESENDRCNAELGSDETSLKNLQNELAVVKSNNGKLQKELDIVKMELEEIQKELDRLKGENYNISKDLEASKSQVETLHRELDSLRKNKVLLNDEFGKVGADTKDLQEQITTLKIECENLQTELGMANTGKADLQEELDTVKSQKGKLISDTQAKTETKIQELKVKFKDVINNIMDSLKESRNTSGKKYFASSVPLPVVEDVNELSSSQSETRSNKPTAMESESAVEESDHFPRREKSDESPLAIQVLELVSKLTDEIFVECEVELNMSSEMEIVMKNESRSSRTMSGLRCSMDSDDLLNVIQRGLIEVKSLSKTNKTRKSSRVKRKHEVVDEMIHFIEKAQLEQGYQ